MKKAFCFVLILTIFSLLATEAFPQASKTFSGKVKAIDPSGRAIVVYQGEGKSEMVVGAIVTNETEVVVRGKPASLKDLKVGDQVTLIYVRTDDLYAKKIVKK